MITVLKLLVSLFVCSAHAKVESVNPESNLARINSYAKYFESVCNGKPFCNDSSIVQPSTIPEGYYKCSCDPECLTYGDCCSDAQTNNFPAKSKSGPKFTCIPKIKFYLVATCPTSFTDAVTRMKCENISWGDAAEDVKIMRPVMDPTSQVTYLNAYCASCNNVTNFERFGLAYNCISRAKAEDHVHLGIDVSPTKALPLVKFDSKSKAFTGTGVDGTFYKCWHQVVIPKNLKPYLRDCLPGTISSCPKTFNDSKIIEKCHSSTYYVVYDSLDSGSGQTYKNEYCAMCNGVKEVIQCQFVSTEAGSSSLWMSSSASGSCDSPMMRQLPFCQ